MKQIPCREDDVGLLGCDALCTRRQIPTAFLASGAAVHDYTSVGLLRCWRLCHVIAGMTRSASDSPVSGPGCAGGSSTVGQWLGSLGLADYESLFRSNGFDDLDFIVSSQLVSR